MDILRHISTWYLHRNHKKPAEERMEWLLSMVGSDPEGKRLLDLAETLHVPIRLNKLPGMLQGCTFSSPYTDKVNRISLNPKCADRSLVQTLIHELRHMEIYQQTGVFKKTRLSPLASVVRNRIDEGDANAYSAFITERIEKKTGKSLIIEYRGHLNKGTRRNETLNQKMTRVFNAFQKDENAFINNGYDGSALLASECRIFSPQGRLTELFNGLLTAMTIDGEQINYLDAKNTAQLARKVLKEVPVRIRKHAIKIDKKMMKDWRQA